jgi:hypothetical protein
MGFWLLAAVAKRIVILSEAKDLSISLVPTIAWSLRYAQNESVEGRR